MSIIENAERYMKRYDYLMAKRERRYSEGKRLSPEEDEELSKLRPTVFTPILVMFELLHETVKTNQSLRKSNNKQNTQTGGAPAPAPASASAPASAPATAAAAAADATATAIAAIATSTAAAGSAIPASVPKADNDAANDKDKDDKDDKDDKANEEQRLSELEESLMPLLTKIIVYIEQNKKKQKKKEGEDEEEKYPDIGTTAKNSAILVIRRIKKWWNDLISGGTSDLSSKINLKKAIPQLANNSGDMNVLNEMADKVITAVDPPLQKISKILANDVRDIASSSVEGIMNALSLIPGIGTTLQLWRLLQNVVVIMSKSVTTMAGAKTQGVALKTNVMGLKDQMAEIATKAATDAATNAATGAVAGVAGAVSDATGGTIPGAPGLPGVPAGLPGVPAALSKMPAALSKMPAALPRFGGGHKKKPNHLRSIKKYKQEYKQSIREIKKTRKRMMRYFNNMI